tara:strand:- start:7947 stop:8492 length:546 start_codon:yes stop_codon:yes gene_type:complete
MSGAIITETPLKGLLIIQPKAFEDSRGYFYESWRSQDYKNLGIEVDFVQDNCSLSRKNVLRGLHIQRSQGQILWPSYGHVMQVTLDVRPESETYGQHFSIELKHTQPTQIYMPPGFAGGFYVFSEVACMNYKCSQYYSPIDEGGVLWSDPDLNIKWPTKTPDLSDRDQTFPQLKNLSSSAI